MHKLRDDIGDCFKFISVQAILFGSALQGAWLVVPDSLREHLPTHMATAIAYTTYAIAAYGVLVKQSIEPKETTDATIKH